MRGRILIAGVHDILRLGAAHPAEATAPRQVGEYFVPSILHCVGIGATDDGLGA
jgi:hypothetical protein